MQGNAESTISRQHPTYRPSICQLQRLALYPKTAYPRLVLAYVSMACASICEIALTSDDLSIEPPYIAHDEKKHPLEK